MTTSRRRFMKTCALLGLSVAVPSQFMAAWAAKGRRAPRRNWSEEEFQARAFRHANSTHCKGLRPLTSKTFERHLKTTFNAAQLNAGKFPLRLIEVNILETTADLETDPNANSDPAAKSAGRECFALVFHGSHRQRLPQHMYTMQHHRLGVFALMLVPISRNGSNAYYYEAVINRMHG